MSRPDERKLNPSRLQIAYDLLQETVSGGVLPQALLAVADRDEVLRCEAYGPEGSLPTDQIYWIASITKPIVATAIMQLVERGRLLIEDPVATYVPEFAANGKEAVTLWHLLTHTSGMADVHWREFDTPPTAEWDLQSGCQSPLLFPPGARFEYCNVSFRILGEIIRRVSGLPHDEYLRREVFAPAGMAETTFRPDLAGDPRLVPVADFPQIPGGLEVVTSLAPPSGGLFSTAADLVAFAQAYLNDGVGRQGRLLGPVAIRVMTSLHTEGIYTHETGQPLPAHWGLSWEKADPHEARLLSPAGYGHGGMSGTYLWVDPEAGLAVVFLTNRVNWDRRPRRAILNAVMAALE